MSYVVQVDWSKLVYELARRGLDTGHLTKAGLDSVSAATLTNIKAGKGVQLAVVARIGRTLAAHEVIPEVEMVLATPGSAA